MSATFSLDDLLDELSRIPDGDKGWRTIELVGILKERGLPHSYKWVNLKMNELKAAGRVRVGHRMGLNLSNQMTPFVVYQIIKREPDAQDAQKGT